MCRVKDLIERLQEFNPEAYVVVGEMNAFDGGFWQHYPKDLLKNVIRSVKEEKESIKTDQRLTEDDRKNYLEKDFIYVKDDDVIVRL